MNTPIHDFVKQYIEDGVSRLHMPGHKGTGPMGCEAWDITEIAGADELYAAEGIIAESERNASALFGTGATFYATEGSSQCVRAMLYLAMANREGTGTRLVALAARNAHKSFLYAAALCDFDVEWIYPGTALRIPFADSPVDPASGAQMVSADALCACPVTPEALAARLEAMSEKPFCVYVTSPDYLGGMQDIAGLSAVCHRHGVPLLVDNAHGAYLKFLPTSRHPMDLGADMCCDSAHKTLPVLTGGAYLHISRAADPRWVDGARDALALFGSTSPSWLILRSLDVCNARLAADYPDALRQTAARVEELKARLASGGFEILAGEPMKLTLRGDGESMAATLRRGGVECEFSDRAYVVLMFTPENPPRDYSKIDAALQTPPGRARESAPALPKPERAMTVRQAVFAPCETVPVAAAVGRVCAAPTVSCPPAVPVAVSGEIVTPAVAAALEYYGIRRIRVCR